MPTSPSSLLDLASHLPRVSPAEIVKMPVRVRREDEVPNREREEVDAHPHYVGEAVGGDDYEDAGEAEDEG